jgi:hypothetical protein
MIHGLFMVPIFPELDGEESFFEKQIVAHLNKKFPAI